MARFVASGALIGMILGFLLALIFPALLNAAFTYNLLGIQALGGPLSNLSSPGSIFNVVSGIALFFMFIGAFIGFIVYKFSHIKPTNPEA